MNRMLMLILAGLLIAGVTCEILAADTPAPPAQPIPGVATGDLIGPFGVGGSNARSREHEFSTWIPQMQDIGIHTVRTLGGTGWNGQRDNFDTLDWQLNYLHDHGMSCGGIFYNYRSGPGERGFPMDDPTGWAKDATALTAHFKGRIKYWELWNEPPNGTARGQTAADYAKYAILTYDAAKKGDPDCLIGLAAASVNINYLDQAIADGAKDHFDYITLHPYETAGCTVDHPGTEPVYLNIARTVRKMLARRDPAKVNCPIIFTELGYAAGGRYNHGGPDTQAYAVVKYYAMGIAQGIANIQWFEGMDGDSGPMGLIDAAGTPRPAYTAMAQMIKYLGIHPTYLGWVMLNNKDYAFVFQGATGTVLITWASSAQPDTVDFGQDAKVVDPLTATVTQAKSWKLTLSPILLDGVPANLLATARADRDKPFPWAGDYTNAKSVSITFGEHTVEKGLHTMSSASIAAAVVGYGGGVRVGEVPGGNVFLVDPNFLSYTSTPIEITALVRRGPDNKPAKISVEYESTHGFNKTTAFDIPDAKGWSTAKWKITDSQFVDMWGYNFRIDPGSYYIQSVTVTKLAP